MADDNLKEMSFWGHIEALRSVLVRSAIVVVSFSIIFFIFMPDIFDSVILAPCRADFILYRVFSGITGFSSLIPDFSNNDFHVELINIQLASQFFIHMSTSMWLAVVCAFPIIIYLLWGFISPALYKRERRGAKRAFFFGNIMFFIGVCVGYFVVFPITFRFLAEYKVSDMVPNQISLDSYMDNFLMLIFVMGVVFELPLVCWILSNMGLLTKSFFKTYRRHAIVVLLIAAAIITPTGDPFTLMVVFLPLYWLYEFSAFLVKPAKVEEDDENENDDTNDSEKPDKNVYEMKRDVRDENGRKL